MSEKCLGKNGAFVVNNHISLVDGPDLRTFLRPPANIPIFWF